MVALGNIMYVNIVHVYYFAATVCNSFRTLSCPLYHYNLQQQQAAGKGHAESKNLNQIAALFFRHMAPRDHS
jgi:hypothetical protein